MSLAQQFEALGRRQLEIQEGIDLLRQSQMDLRRARASAEAWGTTAVIANVIIVPLNVVVNACDLKAASSQLQALIQAAVLATYARTAKSGTRAEGPVKVALGLLKQAITEELKRQGRTAYIPGVNVLVGLSEDALALWQATMTVTTGNREMADMAARLERKVDEAVRELNRLGVERAELLRQMQRMPHMALRHPPSGPDFGTPSS